MTTKFAGHYVIRWVRPQWLPALENGDYSGLEGADAAELNEAIELAEKCGYSYYTPVTEAEFFEWDQDEEAPENYSREEWETRFRNPSYSRGLAGDCVACLFRKL